MFFTRSEIFTVANKARACAKKGALDPKRVNRAIGIVQSHDKDEKYFTTLSPQKFCTCYDSSRGYTCKHIIAKMIETRASQNVEKTVARAEAIARDRHHALKREAIEYLNARKFFNDYMLKVVINTKALKASHTSVERKIIKNVLLDSKNNARKWEKEITRLAGTF